MSFIEVIREADATGELKAVYDRILAGPNPFARRKLWNKLPPIVKAACRKILAKLSPFARRGRGGSLPPIVTIFSLCPGLLEARIGFGRGIYRPNRSGLGRRKEELIATQISALSGCRY